MEITVQSEHDIEADLLALPPHERTVAIENLVSSLSLDVGWIYIITKIINKIITTRELDAEPKIRELLARRITELTTNILPDDLLKGRDSAFRPILASYPAFDVGPQIISFVGYKKGGAQGAQKFGKKAAAPAQTPENPPATSNEITIKFTNNQIAHIVSGAELTIPANSDATLIGYQIIPHQKLRDLPRLTRETMFNAATYSYLFISSHNLFGDYFDFPAEKVSTGNLRDLWRRSKIYNHTRNSPRALEWMRDNFAVEIGKLVPATWASSIVAPGKINIPDPLGAILGTIYLNPCWSSNDSFCAELLMKNLLNLYLYIETFGRDDKATRAEVGKIKALLSLKAASDELITKKIKIFSRAAQFWRAVDFRLDPKRAAALRGLLDPRAGLSAAERKQVDAEIERFSQIVNAEASRCKHVMLVARMRAAMTSEKLRKTFGDVLNISDSPPSSANRGEMIKCKLCQGPLICPHYKVATELRLKNVPMNIIHRSMEEFNEASQRGRIFCKICGEIIIDRFETSNESIAYSSFVDMPDEELKTLVHREISFAIRGLYFSDLTDSRPIINSGVQTVYPLAEEVLEKLRRSKTTSPEEVQLRLQFNIALISIAFLVNIMNGKNNIKISFDTRGEPGRGKKDYKEANRGPKKKKTGGAQKEKRESSDSRKDGRAEEKEKKSGNRVAEDLATGISMLLREKRSILERLKNITPDSVKTSMIEMFKIISARGETVVRMQTKLENVILALWTDPIYAAVYLARATEYNYKASGPNDELRVARSKHWDKSILDSTSEFLGGKPELLIKDGNLYGGISDVSWVSGSPLAAKLKAILAANFATILSEREFEQMRAINMQETLNRFFARVRAKPCEIVVFVSGELNPKYEEILKPFRVDKFGLHMLARRTINKRIVDSKTAYRRVIRDEHPGKILDEGGAFHAFNILIDADDKEYPLAEYNKLISAGKLPSGKIKNLRCSICKKTRPETANVDAKTVVRAYFARAELHNTLNFFEQRCPEGGSHDFGQGGGEKKCKKCGYSSAMATTLEGAIEYHEKYKNEIPREVVDINIARPTFTPPTFELGTWTPNYKVILALCNRLKLSEKVFMLIGAHEGAHIGQITSGTYIPREADSPYESRIYYVISYLRLLYYEYNQLRHLDAVGSSSPALTKLIGDGAAAAVALPSLPSDTFEKIAYFQREHKARIILDFCLQTLAELLTFILEIHHDASKKVREQFCEYFINSVYERESRMAVNDYFSFSLLRTDAEPDTDALDIDTSERDNAVEDEDRAFSTDDLDMDLEDEEDEGDGDEINDLIGDAGDAAGI